MIAVDDRNCLPLRPYAVRLLQATAAAGSGNAGPAASANILQQRAPRRLHLRWADRALFIWLYRCCPRILDAITVVRPETVVRWHRMGVAAYWRWKSRPLGGRPGIGKRRLRPHSPSLGPLANPFAVAAQSKPGRYHVKCKGTCRGNAIEGTMSRTLEDDPAKFRGLLSSAEYKTKVLMVLTDDGNEIRVMEKPEKGAPRFHTLTKTTS
jgi:hypothetical protein